MTRTMLNAVGMLVSVAIILVVTGCADNVRTTKTITTIEEEPVRMVSPGTEVVE